MIKRVPSATYRIQFNYQFTFKDAIELIDYWHSLGISHLYASPITQARSKSLYGYDVINHFQINPEIGTEDEFIELAKKLNEKKMGLILDIVPNHMCIADLKNSWWQNVLENGPSSIYAEYFDIQWKTSKIELTNKVFLPILSQPLGQVIEDQELQIVYQNGAFYFVYQDTYLPINPNSLNKILSFVDLSYLNSLDENDEDLLEYQSILTALSYLPSSTETDREKSLEHNREKEIIKKRLKQLVEKNCLFYDLIQNCLVKINGKKGDSQSFDTLETILKDQVYRLSYWRLSNDLINYRRFFDINELACMHVENDKVFDAIHSLIFKLFRAGWITGLRIDHIDGLYEPVNYLKKLQKELSDQSNFYLIVEKILVGHEKLDVHWPISGTTGYDYLNVLNHFFIDHSTQQTFQEIYEQFLGERNRLSEIICECKKTILTVSMSSELTILARQLEMISEHHRLSYDFAYDNLRNALKEIIASFSVYRTYIQKDDSEVALSDKKVIFKAIESAKRLNPESDNLVFDFIKSVLMLEDPKGIDHQQIAQRREFVLRFQQLTGPVMAKGYEDTALYRAYPLSSINEVGSNAFQFGLSCEDFHHENVLRQQQWPHTLSATSTHDTKRAEEVRLRISTLSEMPMQWEDALKKWHQLNADKKIVLHNTQVPDLNEEYLLYQTLIGSWPFSIENKNVQQEYVKRIQEYMNKALKEAKKHTSWINPDPAYEEAVSNFIAKILDFNHDNPFIVDFKSFIEPIAQATMWSTLSQTLLKMTAPGIPDFYQGSELWDLRLVDPDNRHLVDYKTRQNYLNEFCTETSNEFTHIYKKLIANRETGALKLFLIQQVLDFRKEFVDLFAYGEYEIVEIEGELKNKIFAFKRTWYEKGCLVVVTRFFMSLIQQNFAWDSVNLGSLRMVFKSPLNGKWQNIITKETFNFESEFQLPLSNLLHYFPFALLTNT